MLRATMVCLVAILFASDSRESLLDTFTYTAFAGPVHSFTFNFEAPAFVSDGSSFPFTPFKLTEGDNDWTFTQDLVSLIDPSELNIGCIVFGTPFAGLGAPPPFFGPCSF